MSQDNLKKASLKILVLDSHKLFLDGIIEILRQQYPQAEIITAQTADAALNQVCNEQPHLIIMELALAEKPGMIAPTNTGIQLLKNLLQNYPHLHIVVQSDYLRTLVQLKQEINSHHGGFTVADKRFANKEMLLTRVNWAL
jgi:CheY-like chemotaxis protein